LQINSDVRTTRTDNISEKFQKPCCSGRARKS
jgi:hypothetical protein